MLNGQVLSMDADTMQDISGEGSGDPNEHAPGLFYLLEKRGLAQIATSRGIELFLLGVIRLVSTCFSSMIPSRQHVASQETPA